MAASRLRPRRCAARGDPAAVAEHNRADAASGVALRVGISVGDAVVEAAIFRARRSSRPPACAPRPSGHDPLHRRPCGPSPPTGRAACFGAARVELKGLPDPVVVHEVDWRPSGGRPDGRGLSFGVLGPLEVERDGRPVAVGGPKERLVLACSSRQRATRRLGRRARRRGVGRPAAADRRADVHAYVARLRRALEPAPTRRDADGARDRGSGLPARRRAGAGRRRPVRGAGRDGRDAAAAGRPAGRRRRCAPRWPCGGATPYGEFADVDVVRGRGRPARELRLARRGPLRRRPGRRAGRRLVAELEALVRDTPVPGAAVGPADARAVPRRAASATPSTPTSGPGRCSSTSSASSRARSCGASRRPILAQDPGLDRTPRAAPPRGPAGCRWRSTPSARRSSGATRELAWLRSAWAAAADGDGGFVSVLGPEGIGKTRLVAELAREAHGDGAASCCTAAATTPTAAPGRSSTRAPQRRRLARTASTAAGDGAGRRGRRPAPADVGRRPPGAAGPRRPAPRRRRDARGRRRPRRLVPGRRRCSSSAPSAATDRRRRRRTPTTPVRRRSSSSARSTTRRSPTSAAVRARRLDGRRRPAGRRAVTGGVPLLVHEQASAWARRRAARAGSRRPPGR